MSYITEDEIEEYKDAFALFDKDEEGTIATKDLLMIMRSLGHNLNEAEIKEMTNKLDPEDTGVIEFDLFLEVAWLKIKSIDNVSEIRDALKEYDAEGNGWITTSDLRLTLLDLGEKFTDEEVYEMIREADTDAEGLVNYNDFLDMMTSH